MTHQKKVPAVPAMPVPKEIFFAVNALIHPYGLDFNALLNPQPSNTPATGGPDKKYLSVKEAVEYSSVSRYTLHRAVKAEELAVCKLCPGSKNGKILIPVENLNSWINRK